MSEIKIDSRILNIFSDVLGVPGSAISDETAYDSFEQWDSLRHLAFVGKLEDEFDIYIDIDDVIAMETFAKVKAIVKKCITEQTVAA